MTAIPEEAAMPVETLEGLLAECEDTYARLQRLVMRLNARSGLLQSILDTRSKGPVPDDT